MPLNNRWTRNRPPETDHPTHKYTKRFLLRLKPIPDSPDASLHYGVLRTELAFMLGKYLSDTNLNWECQPLEGSGAFDDAEPVTQPLPPQQLQKNYDELTKEYDDYILRVDNAIKSIKSTIQSLY